MSVVGLLHRKVVIIAQVADDLVQSAVADCAVQRGFIDDALPNDRMWHCLSCAVFWGWRKVAI